METEIKVQKWKLWPRHLFIHIFLFYNNFLFKYTCFYRYLGGAFTDDCLTEVNHMRLHHSQIALSFIESKTKISYMSFGIWDKKSDIFAIFWTHSLRFTFWIWIYPGGIIFLVKVVLYAGMTTLENHKNVYGSHGLHVYIW